MTWAEKTYPSSSWGEKAGPASSTFTPVHGLSAPPGTTLLFLIQDGVDSVGNKRFRLSDVGPAEAVFVHLSGVIQLNDDFSEQNVVAYLSGSDVILDFEGGGWAEI